MAMLFLFRLKAFNRNKKSIAIDMKKDAGRDLVLKMAASSDVFVENFRPGVAKRLGVDYETLRALNLRLVYCSVSAYGQEGMMSDRPIRHHAFLPVGGDRAIDEA